MSIKKKGGGLSREERTVQEERTVPGGDAGNPPDPSRNI